MGTPHSSHDHFSATRWSMVMRATASAPAQAGDALAELAQRYCYPVYAYVRRAGHAPDSAAEITAAYLRELTARSGNAQAQSNFRRYLLDRLNTFLGSHWRKTATAPPSCALQMPADMEARYQREAAACASPEAAYQRAFALEVLARATQRVQDEAAQTGHLPMYQALREFLGREPAPGEIDAIGERLHLPPLALVMALKRLRQRFRELAMQELADTVTSSSDLVVEQGNLHELLRHQR